MQSLRLSPGSTAPVGKLLSATWPMIVIAVLMLSLCIASLSALSSIRAFVNGEGMWSKAERQAIAELQQYASTRLSDHYWRFRTELSVNLGDHQARMQLQSRSPDYDLATRGFIDGRNHPDDVPGMNRLFRLFRHSSLLAPSIAAWTQADGWISQLQQVGEQMHTAVESADATPARIEQLLASANLIHRRVAPLEDEFSSSLGKASRLVLGLLSAFLALCGTILVGMGVFISRITIRRAERMANELRETQEQAFVEQARSHVTLESIADAVLCTNLAQQVTYMNGAAEHLTGWSASEAAQKPLNTILQILPESNKDSVAEAIEGILSGEQRAGSTTGSLLKRRDGSTVTIHEHAAPICDSRGQVIGIVFVLRDITQERAFAAQLRHQATHDALTGLANRREFEHQLRLAIEEYQRSGADYALLYLDLDQFKVINDTCGHAAGDELICLVSAAVTGKLRKNDLLARLGGDEFGVLLADCPRPEALHMAESIRRRISELRFLWKGKTFIVNSSIGVLSLADSLPTVDDALSAADQACYLAKDNGRNRSQIYRPDDQEMRARHGEMQWVERINSALEFDRFVLFAQEIRPLAVANAPGLRKEGSQFEILIRMIEADGTLISPMAFMPAAERYDLMPRIDRWVIANACKILYEMRAHNVTVPTCMINLSGASVNDPGIVDFVQANLAKLGLAGDRIGFELTETVAIANLARASELMNRLRAIGCPLSLDDFGSGMSSFAYLRGLPVDYLKIDGEFVKQMAADAIDYAVVEAIHHIGRVMGIKTIGESVENEAILSSLMLVGVDFAQGFHLGRPIPMIEALNRLSLGVPVQMADAVPRHVAALRR
jgi:diguanylate cyclase (GGDEF)-like protein/PAS domain S-box-containing protein